MEPLVAAARAETVAAGAGDAPSRAASAVDSPSWPELVRVVHRHMRSLVGPSRELEDLTQAALEQVVRSLPRFEGRSELTTFTYRICARVAMNHWRWWRRWLRRFEPGGVDPSEAFVAAEEPALSIERERARTLHRALERLAPVKRVCVTLADLEELPASRIAEILGCPEPTVRSRLRQARFELATLLRDDPLFREMTDGGVS
jgi:RNA polymerase sigma-70 factor (ECF subfamily)